MPSDTSIPTSSAASRASEFPITHWTLLCQAGDALSPDHLAALEVMCRRYWSPVLSFCRQRGLAREDAEDAVQGFFAQFLSRKSVSRADPTKGRFRTFLLACLKNYLADEHDKAKTVKRGGGTEFIPLEVMAEQSAFEPVDEGDSPELVYDRRWARALVDGVLAQLRVEFENEGQARLFALLNADERGADGAPLRNAEIGVLLGMNDDAVKYQARLLKQRFQTLLRVEIGKTVESATEVDAELNHLLRLLR